MCDKTAIEWTDATWNPLRGCARISEGCRHCYAEAVAHRFSGPGMPYEGLTRIVNGRPTWTGEVRMIPELLDQPLRWRKPRRIFVNSMSDLFHENVPDYFIDRVFGVMWACHVCDKQHVFQILTKRAQRMRDYLKHDRRKNWARAAVNIAGRYDPDGLFDDIANSQEPHPRIWLGVSVENQPAADERIPLLLDTQAAVRWISAEPLLGEIDLDAIANTARLAEGQRYISATIGSAWESHAGYLDTCKINALDWIVAGGESGPHARPSHPDWFRTLRDQCNEAGVPFLFKQWGEWLPGSQASDIGNQTALIGACQRGHRWDSGAHSWNIGKKAAGRLLDGVLHDEYPEGVS